MELKTGENDTGRRLDRILRKALPDHPLALIHRLLRRKQVFINGKPAKPQDRVESGAIISIPCLTKSQKLSAKHKTKSPYISEVNSSIIAAPIWQDIGLIAFNKPAGLAVHGRDSLDTMVRSFLSDKLPPSLSFTPGPLHRLDKPSSGIVVFPTSLDGAQLFTSLMKDHKIKKTYLAIVEGIVSKDEIWEDKLIRDREKKKTFTSNTSSAKTAVTKITPLASNSGFSLIQAEIVTGRTHQIRAQAQAHSHPLLGDIKYNGQSAESRERGSKRNNYIAGFYLHARKLEFLDYKIEAPLPEAFKKKLDEIFGDISIIY
ncbi:MAG: RluA family pseudouridine synthase [Treponema sp.]|nr:RluA family pseudouridine synthase [Treponema sp.]